MVREPEAGMTDNVVTLNMVTRLPIPVDRVLDDAQAAGLTQVIVIGVTADGEEYFASSEADGGNVLWQMERAKKRLLAVPDRDDL